MSFVFDDGGRAAAGYKGFTGDCGVRALAIAAERPYQEIYDMVGEYAKRERTGKRKRTRSHPRTGIYRATYDKMCFELGGVWEPCMKPGTGCRVRVRPDELPHGVLILRLSKHFAAFKYGELRDTYDSSRGGTRCVYGFYRFD